jgi:hypothetical protein
MRLEMVEKKRAFRQWQLHKAGASGRHDKGKATRRAGLSDCRIPDNGAFLQQGEFAGYCLLSKFSLAHYLLDRVGRTNHAARDTSDHH